MLKGVHLTLMIGPLVPLPVPQAVLDALTSVTVTTDDSGKSGFQLSFTLSNRSPLHTLFLLTGGSPLPILRVIIVVTLNGTPNVLMDGSVTNHQIAPGADAGHSTLTLTGEDLTVLMDKIDFSGFPYPAVPAEGRVALLLLKYAFLGIVPLIIPSVLVDVVIPTNQIPRHKGTDLKYIKHLAQRVGSVVWTADNRTLFYSVEDEETKRQFQVFRHVVGRPQDEDVLVYEEADERFNVGIGRTRDKKYMVLESASHTTGEEQFLPADQPEGPWTLIEPRRENIEYSADHRDGLWYIRVNDTARTFRIVTTPVDNPGRAHWRELMAHRDDVMLEDLELFQSFAVLEERFDGLPHLRILNFDAQGSFAGPSPQIAFPEPTYSAHPHVNREFVTGTFRYGYTSLVSPTSNRRNQ